MEQKIKKQKIESEKPLEGGKAARDFMSSCSDSESETEKPPKMNVDTILKKRKRDDSKAG